MASTYRAIAPRQSCRDRRLPSPITPSSSTATPSQPTRWCSRPTARVVVPTTTPRRRGLPMAMRLCRSHAGTTLTSSKRPPSFPRCRPARPCPQQPSSSQDGFTQDPAHARHCPSALQPHHCQTTTSCQTLSFCGRAKTRWRGAIGAALSRLMHGGSPLAPALSVAPTARAGCL